MARPDFAHYVEGWPRDGYVGVVAEDEHGEPVGAAWYRHLSDDDPGYGFIDPSIPEVTIGVVARRRGQGVGRDLLEALAAEASRAGVTA